MIYLAFVDDGHGINTSGKETPFIKSIGRAIKEKEFNKPVADLLIEEFKRCGVEVFDVAPGWDDVALSARTAQANTIYKNYCAQYGRENVKAIFISFHFDAIDGNFAAPSPSGFSVRIQPGTRDKEAGRLAQCIIEELAKGTKQINRGIVEQNLHVTRETLMAAVLSENGFMDNEIEAGLMLNPVFQKEVAQEHARGACKYFGIAYVPEAIKAIDLQTDYAGHWAQKEIEAVIKSGLMVGKANGIFEPDKPITRAELAVILNRILNKI